MSGHSKWSQIKHQKGAADAKRGAVFSKLAKAISVAARHGADPEMNFQLRIAVDQARAANMPKDNIERAIERSTGAGAAALEEFTFEAYGPAGTAFILEVATDNHNRTLGEIRAVLNKFGGKLAESGSVAYLFRHRGQINVATSDAETIELAAIDAGAEDVETADGHVFIATEPKELEHVRRRLAEQGIEGEASFEWQPLATIPVTDQATADKTLKFANALDELDDVTAVHSNFELVDR